MIAFSQGGSEDESSGIQVTLRRADGSLEEVNAAYLIDAEGAHSTVRHTLGLPFRGKSLPHSYALADLHLKGDVPGDQMLLFLSLHGLLTAFPMGGHRFRLIASEPDNTPATDVPNPDLAYMQALWQQNSHIPVRCFDMVWSSRFRVNSRMLDQLRQGRIFFGGDSAHVHSPAGGQGMNTGIQDMINLGWKLAMVYTGQAKTQLLDTYQTERIPIIRTLVSVTETATDLAGSDSPFMHTLIQHALPIALSFRAIQKRGLGYASELEGNYRESTLSMAHGSAGKLRPGDRVPDLKVRQNGAYAGLLLLLDPTRFTLLLVGDTPSVEPFRSYVNDWNVQRISAPIDGAESAPFNEAIGKAEWLLIRPDGYLVGASTTGNSESLVQWCSTWLI